jgi:endoribonuclease LACTB2
LSSDTEVYKHQPDPGQLDISDGQIFQVDGASLKAVFAPGHTDDHMVFVWEEEDALFTGDNVVGQGTVVIEDLGTYLDSLDCMQTLAKGRAYPGHGPLIDDAPAKIQEYIRHREERVDQVVQLLRSQGPEESRPSRTGWTAMELVRVIYRDYREDLYVAAEKGVLQILNQLEKQDRVIQESGKWRT